MEYPVTLMICGKPETIFNFREFLELVRLRMGDEAAAFADFSEDEEEFQRVQEELSDATNRILDLEDELQTAISERDYFQTETGILNRKISELESELESARKWKNRS